MRYQFSHFANLFIYIILIKYINAENCKENEFRCKNGQCIKKALVCDHNSDCSDNSDENDCELVFCQEPNFFRCKNMKCISVSFKCDGDNDCGDFSDEESCENFKKNFVSSSGCAANEWQCADSLCIDREWVCNGEADCLDGTDETIGCTANIECDTFRCKNNHCIPNEWKCDGNDDCHDNSDEEHCEYTTNITDCTLDNQKFLCSDNKSCISRDKVCDGKPQCFDQSDESPWCTSPTTSCHKMNCSHDCVQLPTGAKCICPKGFKTLTDTHCEDINECEEYGICDQKCKNLQGSYECFCDPGYILQPDKKTCKSQDSDPIMYFSSKTEIRAYRLNTQIYYPVAKNLKQVVGVKFDGSHLYWTDIYSEHESIVMAQKDGSNRELVVTSGLGSPEDLDIDWITGNIYFTDAERQHIGACNNDGTHCTIIVNKDIHKPRGIILNPEKGEMYWTDWGSRPEIARAMMDGSKDTAFVSTEIHWPNGLTLDFPNERLYWTDAKIHTLESIRLDGTDRRVVLEGIIKHPYAIAVFEDRLYWSDWHTHSIQSCHKFTGKDHHTLIKEKKEFIYGIDIYHESISRKGNNPCLGAFCSDICLLSGTGYVCACPQDKQLASDGHTCKELGKKQMLILGTGDLLVHVEHQLLGKHEITVLPVSVKKVGALSYNSIENTLYISDLEAKKILSLNFHTAKVDTLISDDLGKIVAMDFDYLGNNLYLCDEEKGTVELVNLRTLKRKVLLYDMHGEIPEAIALIPEEGVMFIGFKKIHKGGSHVDRLFMNGKGRTHPIEHGLLGPVSLLYDQDLHKIFISDAGTGNIETTSVEGDERHGFRSLLTSPISITSLKTDLFWVNENSRRLYWAEKYNNEKTYNKKITLDIPEETNRIYLTSVTPKKIGDHPCQHNNGDCSHFCIVSQKSFTCECPIGMTLKDDNRTCTSRLTCKPNEFYCAISNQCILHEKRCNKKNDCEFGEDEENCRINVECLHGHFMCEDGQCVNETLRCNHIFDCKDKSDEQNCENFHRNECPEFTCNDGSCLSQRFICDGNNDCANGEDEKDCPLTECTEKQFRCNSGACIPKNWECDSQFDCPDLSDEHPKCRSCNDKSFICHNNRCIDKSFVCDENDDCGDNSDELNCQEMIDICPPGTIPCASNRSICIPESAKCNGTSECPHHEDEQDCSDCHIEEFVCNNKKCIPTQWICDHSDDCGDSSDESPDLCLHPSKIATHQQRKDNSCEHGYRCKNGDCIDFDQVCNGVPDCYDLSDEGGLCQKACNGNNNPCQQKCIKTPSGPICQCNEGFKLLGDSHNCEDINECLSHPPKCSQICVNSIGSYRCDCFNGFLIKSDKKSCKAEETAMALYFTTENQIRELSQTNNSLRLIFQDELPKYTGLDVITSKQTIYFSIETTGTIHRINVANQAREYMDKVGAPQKIALDWITNNIYYINNDPQSKSINICNFDDKGCAKLATLDLHRQISAFAVDAVNKVMFYSSISWWLFNSPSFIIYKRNLDGSDVQELIKSKTGYITGISYDFNKQLIYYVDQHSGELHQINYDGTMDTVIASNLTRPRGLNFFEDHLYFLTVGGYMGRCQLYEPAGCDHFKLHGSSSELFIISQQSRQPFTDNHCDNHTCSHLCVPTKIHYKCLCEDGRVITSEENCKTDKEAIGSHKPSIHTYIAQNDKAASEKTTVVAVVIPVGLLLFGSAVFYLFKKKNSGSMNLSTIRFQNPGYGLQYNEETGDKAVISNTLDSGSHEYINPIVNYAERDNDERSNLLVNV